MGKKGGGSAGYQRQQEQERQDAIRQGTASIDTVFEEFDDGFFDQQRQAYLDYAMPQLEDQRTGASRELVYSLARSGQLEGSARAQQQSELGKLYDLESQNIADKALDHENKSRTGVENARSDLVSTLNATGDATGAANSALARSAALSQPDAYSPLADLFTSYTNALGTSAAAERARSHGWGAQQQTGSPTWYQPPKASVSVKG